MTTEETALQALDSARSAHKRIDSVEKDVRDIRQLTAAMARVDERVEGLDNDVKEIKADVKAITARPGRLWDKLIAAAVGAVATGFITAVLALVLK